MFDSQSTCKCRRDFCSKVTFPFNSRKCIEESRGVVDYIKYVRKVKERFFCIPVRSISHTLITSFRLLLSDQSPEQLERSLNLELADSFIVDQAASSTQPGPSSRNAQPGPSGSNTQPGPSGNSHSDASESNLLENGGSDCNPDLGARNIQHEVSPCNKRPIDETECSDDEGRKRHHTVMVMHPKNMILMHSKKMIIQPPMLEMRWKTWRMGTQSLLLWMLQK